MDQPHINLDFDKVTEAVSVLIEKVQERKNEEEERAFKKKLFEDSPEYVSLLLLLREIPLPKHVHLLRLTLPHQILPENTEICIFIADRPELKQTIKSLNIPNVKKIYTVTQLRKRCGKSFEARRILLQRFDLFIAHETILPLLPRLVGSTFLRDQKTVPVPFKAPRGETEKVIENQIHSILHSTFFKWTSGVHYNIRVGRLDQKTEEIVENIKSVCEQVSRFIPFGLQNLITLFVKTTSSIELPIWTNFPSILAILQNLAQQHQQKNSLPVENKVSEADLDQNDHQSQSNITIEEVYDNENENDQSESVTEDVQDEMNAEEPKPKKQRTKNNAQKTIQKKNKKNSTLPQTKIKTKVSSASKS